MPATDLRSYFTKDNYFRIAYGRYESFKKTSIYQESYKKEILSRLNQEFQENPITEDNVLDKAKMIQQENPSSGSFVHWSSVADLVKYAEARPSEASEVWNQLFDTSLSVDERIKAFRSKALAFDETLSLGAPLFGYLLAAYDYTAYPIYKQEVFQAVKQTYGIDWKLRDVGENYAKYFEMCEAALDVLKEDYSDLNMLDVQDFFYCSTQYNAIIVESAVAYLHKLAQQLKRFMENPSYMLEIISEFDNSHLEELREMYRDQEKVNKIKFMVLDKLINEGNVSISDLERFKAEVSKQYDTKILNSFNNFTILFHLFYTHKKEKVNHELTKVHSIIRHFPEFQHMDFVEDKAINGFSWNQNYGTSYAWIVVYDAKYATHRNAPQLTLGIMDTGIRYGLDHGVDHSKANLHEDLTYLSDIREFTYEDFKQKLIDVSSAVVSEYEEAAPPQEHYNDDVFTSDEWLNLFHDDRIFYPRDKDYLFKMLEWDGSATGTELGEIFGLTYSGVNSVIGNLAKRVAKYTGAEVPAPDNQTFRYWRLLFYGGRDDDNPHFKWTMKENLHQAVKRLFNEVNEPYTKDGFLQDVFMDEATYDTMAELLGYKKNMILQGPPGTGKTFVAKRLAKSLVGLEDDDRIEMIQFHQNYAYEDFVMGYRPDQGGFSLQTGIFYNFCKRALENPEKDYYMVIDEINRGNLAKIFGELFMLIERDKRDEYVSLSYSGEKFTVPQNLYLIGTMNTADRSLAQLEIALRRRFAFFTMEPLFNEKWAAHMREQGLSDEMIERIWRDIDSINEKIRNDFQLGRDFEIGHSFFTVFPDNVEENVWYQRIIRFEIKPLLEEYFYDRPEEARQLIEGMLDGSNI